MTARVALEPIGEQETVLRYTANAEIGGKLASVGSRLVQSVAKKNADHFFAAFSRQLTGQPGTATMASGAMPSAGEAAWQAASAGAYHSGKTGLGASVPAWLVVFGTGLGAALGYCLALLTG